MNFIVIDEFTGKKVTEREKYILAAEGGLAENDIEGFGITQDGYLILLDECGHFMYVDMERFKIKYAKQIYGQKNHYKNTN